MEFVINRISHIAKYLNWGYGSRKRLKKQTNKQNQIKKEEFDLYTIRNCFVYCTLNIWLVHEKVLFVTSNWNAPFCFIK